MNTNEHPKALEARKRAEIRTSQKEKIKRLISSHNLHFYVVGKYTFCYRVDKRNVIEVSSTIRHPEDRNDPHIGRMHALTRFVAGNRIYMRMPNWCNGPRAFLRITFTE